MQVPVGAAKVSRHSNWIICDIRVSLRKNDLVECPGSLAAGNLSERDHALKMTLQLE